MSTSTFPRSEKTAFAETAMLPFTVARAESHETVLSLPSSLTSIASSSRSGRRNSPVVHRRCVEERFAMTSALWGFGGVHGGLALALLHRQRRTGAHGVAAVVDDDVPPDELRLIVLMDSLAPSYAAVLQSPVPMPTVTFAGIPGSGLATASSPSILLRARTDIAARDGWLLERLDAWSI